jgi:hypothetical protein
MLAGDVRRGRRTGERVHLLMCEVALLGRSDAREIDVSRGVARQPFVLNSERQDQGNSFPP